MWLLIHAGIKDNHVSKSGLRLPELKQRHWLYTNFYTATSVEMQLRINDDLA